MDYLLWLAWDQRRVVNPVTGAETGPYEPWQVVGVGAVLLFLALVVGWKRHAVLAVIVIPTAFTACWIIDAATQQTPDANLWPIGAIYLAVGCVLGTAFFAVLGVGARALRDRSVRVEKSVQP